MRLRYTLKGAAELEQVLDYIEAESPEGARRVQARIQFIIDLLLRHPGQVSLRARAVSDA